MTPQKSQALSLGPINLTLFGKRIFADGIQVRDLDTGRLSWIYGWVLKIITGVP